MIGALPGADVVIASYAVLVSIAVVVIDARTHRIPNRLTLAWSCGVLAIAVVAAAVEGSWRDLGRSAATGAAMFVVGYLLAMLSPDAFGFGDVKLLGCVGLVLGHLDPQLVVVWLLGLAAATVLWLLAAPWLDGQWDRRTPLRKRSIAFGPPIVLALWLTYAAILALR